MDGGRAQKRGRLVIDDLKVVSLLQGQPGAVLDRIVQSGLRREFAKGECVIDAAKAPTAVYLLLQGQVRVQLLGQGQREITYQLLNAGEMFGELACIDNGPRTADVTAETDVVVAQIPAAEFRNLLLKHAEFAMVILRRVVSLSRWLSERVFEYHAYNLMGRICAELLRLSRAAKGADFSVTDTDMASRVGTDRSMVNKLVRKIVKLEPGALHRVPRSPHFRVVDASRLTALLARCELG